MTSPVRGQAYMVEVPEIGEEKPFLVVSNNMVGALPPRVMVDVGEGLRSALGLEPEI